MIKKDKKENSPISSGQVNRPPVVVVMGHIDHGKSTLLDYIRKTNTTEKEAGGITQRISAYEVRVEVGGEKRKITFLDTPGHAAFCSIRTHGARVADMAVLVVSAEDGVKPQTIEALGCIKEDNMPFIVALNKIDKVGADINKTKQDLAENGILVEGWGGIIPVAAISAKTGEGIPELLEMIILQTDLENLKGEQDIPAEGFVIESDLNPRQGISSTLIIKNGSLKVGMFVATEGAHAPVRIIENHKGENLEEVSFSAPIRIVGWSKKPVVGSRFVAFNSKEDALGFAAKDTAPEPEIKRCDEDNSDDCAFFEIVVKADTSGSLDAVKQELQKLSNEKIRVKIILGDVGTITEKDIKIARVKNSLVLGFNVDIDKAAEILAMRDKVETKVYKVIYDLVDYIKERVEKSTPTEAVETVIGCAKVIKLFSQNKNRQIIGGQMEEGEIKSGATVKIYRRESLIGEGKVRELQIQKNKIGAVKGEEQFGMMVESKTEIVRGDILKETSLVKQ